MDFFVNLNRHILTIAASCLLSSVGHAQANDETLEEVARFFAGADVLAGPTIVDCTLSGGTETECFSITVKSEPMDYTPGPWCPTDISDGAEAGGIWLENGEAHDVDGNFVVNLAEFYDDPNWQLFNPETGEINYTSTQEACEAAARPDVDPAYQNHCVQCLLEYMPDDASMTYVIPLEPHMASEPTPTNFTGSGVANNGIRMDGPAPVSDILGAYTIAPFDDCGGHVNTHVGYHYHAVTDCLNGASADLAHGAQIGIAMDGHAIFTQLIADDTAPEGLDSCNGHETDDIGYHYHAGDAGSNAILGCLVAEGGCALTNPDGTCDASARPRRP